MVNTQQSKTSRIFQLGLKSGWYVRYQAKEREGASSLQLEAPHIHDTKAIIVIRSDNFHDADL